MNATKPHLDLTRRALVSVDLTFEELTAIQQDVAAAGHDCDNLTAGSILDRWIKIKLDEKPQ